MTTQNAEQEFLNELASDNIKVNDDSFIPPTPKKEEPKAEESDDEESPRNRRERRFVKEMERIRLEAQQDREARIAAEERAKAVLELGQKADASADPDEYKVYNLDTPEGKFLKSFFDKKLSQAEERAYKRAVDEFNKANAQEREQEVMNSRTIDKGFDLIEEEYNVDLSGDSKSSRDLRNGFIDFLSDISPKDESGEIIEYADFEKSFAIYQQMNKKPNETSQARKAIADRSMTSSGQTSAPQGKQFRSGREYIDYMLNQN